MNVTPLDSQVQVFFNNDVVNYWWIFFMENNPKRLVLTLLFFLCLLQAIELAKSFINSSWTKNMKRDDFAINKFPCDKVKVRLRLVAGMSLSAISFILTRCIWFHYRLHQLNQPAISNNGLMHLELFVDFTVALLTLLAQFLTIELHSTLLCQSEEEAQKTSLYAHYVMVILINILSAGVVFNCMMNFHSNALQLLDIS